MVHIYSGMDPYYTRVHTMESNGLSPYYGLHLLYLKKSRLIHKWSKTTIHCLFYTQLYIRIDKPLLTQGSLPTKKSIIIFFFFNIQISLSFF